MTCHARIFRSKVVIFSQFLSRSLSTKKIEKEIFLNNFYPVISYRRVIVHGLVTRYGPQSVANGQTLFERGRIYITLHRNH